MKIQLPFNVIAFMIFLYFIFLLFKGWKISTALKKHQRLPPTPWKLPLIGNLHHLVGALPHRSLEKLAEKYGPIVHLKLGEVSAIVVSSAELAKEVLKVQDPACADRPQTIVSKIMLYDSTDMGFSPYNEYWRQMRKICVLELLSAKNVRSFNSIRQDEASRLIKSIQSSRGEPINLTEKIFSFTSSITCRAAFGKVIRDRDILLSLLKKAVPLTGGFGLVDLFPSFKLLHVISWNKHKLLAMRRKLDVILDAIVDEHRANLAKTHNGNGEFGGEDIVDVLLRIKESGDQDIAITIDNIKAIIFVSNFIWNNNVTFILQEETRPYSR